MLVDADGQLRWASAADQTAQTIEDGQERPAQGPCAVAFSQRLPAAIRDVRTSTRRLADVAREVTAGQPLPADRRRLAKARARQAEDRETGSRPARGPTGGGYSRPGLRGSAQGRPLLLASSCCPST
ncbi:MAG TPA: hypothetical protein VJ140_14475 [Actinomycetota bacterium]|nr:hypothetical protein [Actinomycetota bacterium]